MSFKQIWICQCDLCGKIEKAKHYLDADCTYPDGWTTGYNDNFHMCPDCAKKVKS